mgnify:CR=1 FL=1
MRNQQPSSQTLFPYRDQDLRAVLRLLAEGECVAVIGLSNFGKSTLLRALQTPLAAACYHDLAGAEALFVYVDCNRMLELSPRGFFEATLRAILEALPEDAATLRAEVERQYHIVVNPPNDFAAPLAFNNALVALVEDDARRVILLLDEFDEVLAGIEPRILLNLRALRDKYGPHLCYVIASVTPPAQSRQNPLVAEFAELFTVGRHYLGPLPPQEALRLAAELFAAANDSLDAPEGEFILAQAGGHPGLIQAVVRTLLQVESGAPQLYQQQAFALAHAEMEHDRLILSELARLWEQLTPQEQQAVIDWVTRGETSEEGHKRLLQRGVLVPAEAQGLVPGEGGQPPRLFGQLFARFARRKALTRQGIPSGVWVDTDSGEVWVDGLPVPTLTELEYRLLLLLYGRLDKLCDKYQLVEAVWGQEYLDEVDDARIEKLVSRLRAKLEANPQAGRYLVTVRGRGYKLSSTPEAAA